MASTELDEREGGAASRAGGAEAGGGRFRALGHRNFRLFWAGAFLSNTGTWMQSVAQGWLVLQLTDSAFWLGFDGFVATVPGLLLTLVGGVFADIFDRKRMLIMTQVAAGLVALVVAALIWTEVVHFSMILAASFVTGVCFSIAGPSYQAITIDLVGRRDLANAIALNSAQFQLSRVLGPVFAGLAFGTLGVAGCFLLNGLSFVAIVAALSLVRFGGGTAAAAGLTAAPRPAASVRVVWHDLVEGLRYVRNRPRVSTLLVISSVTSVFGAPYLMLMPLFARDVLHLNASGLSLMMATAGAGSFLAAVWLTVRGDVRGKGWYVLGGTFAFGVCLVGFALSKSVGASFAFLFFLGFGIVLSVAVTNMLLQKLVTDEMRGRVMSMFILSFVGAFPVGSFIAGAAAERYGAPRTLAAGGVLVAAFALVVAATNPRLRALD